MSTLRLSIVFTLSSAASFAYCQSPQFAWAHDLPLQLNGTFNDQPPYVVAADASGGALVLGMESFGTSYGATPFGPLQLVHFTSDGTQDLPLTFPGNGEAQQLRYAPDGSIYLLGQYLDSIAFGSTVLTTTGSALHAFFAKLDGTGDALWALDLSVPYGLTEGPKGLAVNAQGEAYIAIHSGDLGRVVHFSNSGTVLSSIEQSTSGINSLDVDELGNIYVSGVCAPDEGAFFGGVHFAPSVVDGQGYNRYLARYRPDGQPSFVKFSLDATCSTSQVRCADANTIYWAGRLISPTLFDDLPLLGPAAGSISDLHLVKLDSTGTYAWAVEGPIGQNIGVNIGLQSFLDIDPDGNPVIAGASRGTLAWPDGSATNSLGSFDPLVFSYHADGTFRWAKSMHSIGSNDGAHSLSIASDGSIYAVGLARGTCTMDTITVGPGGPNFPFVAKLGADLSTGITGSTRRSFTIAPNPAVNSVQLLHAGELISLQCMNTTGQLLNVPRTGDRTDVSMLSPGLYLFQLKTTEGTESITFMKSAE